MSSSNEKKLPELSNEPLDPHFQKPEDWEGEPPKTVKEFYGRWGERQRCTLKRMTADFNKLHRTSLSPDEYLEILIKIRENLGGLKLT